MNEITLTTSNLSNSEVAGLTGLAADGDAMIVIVIIVGIIAAIAGYVISSYLLSRIFKKAGVETSIAWIPIYNSWKLLEMGDQKGFWALLALIPPLAIVSTVFTYIAMYHIGKKFGKEDWFVALAIFLPIVWVIILGFDKSQWNGVTVEATPTVPTQPVDTMPAEAPVAEVAPAPIAEPATMAETAVPTVETFTAPQMPEATPAESTYTTPDLAEAPTEAPVAPEPTYSEPEAPTMPTEPEMPAEPAVDEVPTVSESADAPTDTDIQ